MDSAFAASTIQSHYRGVTHHSNIYFARDEKNVIIVTMHQDPVSRIHYEDKSPTVVNSPFDSHSLGEIVQISLLKTSLTPLVLAGRPKESDWPSYKTSKETSMKKFCEHYLLIMINGVNNKNLFYEIDGEPYKDAKLHVKSIINRHASPEEMGERLLLVFRSCRDQVLHDE